MAYRAELDPRSRSGAIIAVIAVHALLLFALLYLPGRIGSSANQSVLRIFDVIDLPPPVPPPRPPEPAAKHKPGGSAPANIKSEATQVVAPKPRVETPPIQALPATETPREGTAPTEGQSNVQGPGTGGGGNGNGNGNGNGGGAGAGEAVAVPAALIRGISGREYPEALQRSWPRGGIIYVRLRIEPNGRPSRCDVMRSFGDPTADQWTCALLMQRSEFRPALNARGAPIAAWFGYKQVDIDR